MREMTDSEATTDGEAQTDGEAATDGSGDVASADPSRKGTVGRSER